MLIWKIGEGYNHSNHRDYLIKDASELAQIDDCAPGSTAVTYDLSQVFVLDEDGNWQEA